MAPPHYAPRAQTDMDGLASTGRTLIGVSTATHAAAAAATAAQTDTLPPGGELYVVGKAVKAVLDLKSVHAPMLNDAFSHLLTLRLIPGIPMALINVAAGLVGVPARTFVLSSFLGMLPASLIFAGLGSSLGEVLAHGGRLTPDVLLQPQIVAPMVGLAVLSLTPHAWRAWTRRRAADRPVAGGPPVQ